MRLFSLYLRGRRAGYAAGSILLVAVMAGLALALSDSDIIPLIVMLMPVAVAAIIGLSTSTPFGQLEQTVSYPLAALRLGHLGGLVLVALLALIGATIGTTASENWLALARNILGYAGLALIAATLLEPAYSWSVPVVYGIAVLVAGSEKLWAWPLQPAGDGPAAALAAGLLAVGLALVALRGTGDGPTEMEA